MSCWDDISRHSSDFFWMADPLVRRRIGERVSGDPDVAYPIAWFARQMRDELPLSRVLSVGCGTGGAERHLLELDAVRHVTGIDTSLPAIEYARAAAAAAGIADRVVYENSDAHDFLARTGGWNAIFFHASLHHLDRLPELFRLIESALAPRGILFLDEYIGPSRLEWNWRRMILANCFYALLPTSLRRTHIVRPPVTDEDPTEMICASEIGPLTRKHFDIVEWRDYGGNLVSLIYPSLRRPAEGDDAAAARYAKALASLFRAEDFLLRHPRFPGAPSFHAVVIARKR
jgi:SAM-dependent methyltransferase